MRRRTSRPAEVPEPKGSIWSGGWRYALLWGFAIVLMAYALGYLQIIKGVIKSAYQLIRTGI